jgi:hypothetical protein
VERALEGLIGKKELEKIVSAWRRHVDVMISISMVELTRESAVGKGRDSRCNGSIRVQEGCVSLYTY